MTDRAQELMEALAVLRRKALTPEQEARREVVRRRSLAIQAGIKAPVSGTFGKVAKG